MGDYIDNEVTDVKEETTSNNIGGDNGMFSIRPDYYNDIEISPLEYIKANKLDFCEGNVIKYVTRHRQKNGKEDLIKAKTYIEELIKEYANEK